MSASDSLRISEPKAAALVEADVDEASATCAGDVRAALCAAFIAAIDGNLNELGTGANAGASSADEEDLEVGITAIVMSGGVPDCNDYG